VGHEAGEEHRLVGAYRLSDHVVDVVVRIVFIIRYLSLKVIVNNLVEHSGSGIFGTTAHCRIGKVGFQHQIVRMLGQNTTGSADGELYAAGVPNAKVRFFQLMRGYTKWK